MLHGGVFARRRKTVLFILIFFIFRGSEFSVLGSNIKVFTIWLLVRRLFSNQIFYCCVPESLSLNALWDQESISDQGEGTKSGT